MPVQLRRDELLDPPAPQRNVDDTQDLRAGLLAAVRSSLRCLAIAAILLLIGLRMMKPALLAADYLLHRGQGDHWQESWMPVVLFMIFGAIFGTAVVWRIDTRTSLGGTSSCLIAAAAALLLLAVGALAATLVFEVVPFMSWLSLIGMMLAAIAGAYGRTLWTG